jgi:hypothetical protein
MTKKQTAVQWLASELSGHLGPSNGPELLGILNQALAMEKEQIKVAYQAGDGDAYNLDDTNKWAEQYYEETFLGVDD